MSESPRRELCLHLTGGRGRLAAFSAAYFRARGFTVKLYSRTDGPGFQALETLLVNGAVAPGDTVLHLAWSTVPVTSECSPGSEVAEDLPFLERLLEVLGRTSGTLIPHLIFFSSGGAVYGNAGLVASRETDLCRPLGNYGRAKLAAEGLVREYRGWKLGAAAILRISNPYGAPGDPVRPQGVINRAIACAYLGTELTVWGDGTARKDYLFIDDFLDALEGVVRTRLAGTYNVCSGESHCVKEVIELIEAASERRIARRYSAAPAWDVGDSRLDGGRLRDALSWRPQVEFRMGIRRAVERFVTAATVVGTANQLPP